MTELHLCIIGVNNGKPIVKKVTTEELKELNKPVEPKECKSKYDPFIRTRPRGKYYTTMYRQISHRMHYDAILYRIDC